MIKDQKKELRNFDISHPKKKHLRNYIGRTIVLNYQFLLAIVSRFEDSPKPEVLRKGPTQVSLSKRWISKLKHQTLSSIFSVGASKSMDSRKRDHIFFWGKEQLIVDFFKARACREDSYLSCVQGTKYLNIWVSHHQWLTRFEADSARSLETFGGPPFWWISQKWPID